MSYVSLPDPHPGRCRNYRTLPYATDTLRCLEYEGTQHVCRFPQPPVNTAQLPGMSAYTMPQPKPWVRPDNNWIGAVPI